jgi:hypothetical protein
MAVRIFRSSDAGAPTMSGTQGDMIRLLDQILVNGYGVAATNTVTSNNTNVSNGDTVTINGAVYTFVTSLSGASYEVLIGANADASLTNLRKAVNGSGIPGTDYGLNTAVNRDVTAGAVTSHAITLTAISTGTIGNSLTLAKSATTLTVGGATFSGGSNTSSPAGWTKPYSQTGAPFINALLTNGTAQAASGTTSPTVTFAAATALQTGDLLIMYVWTNDGVGTNTITTPTAVGTWNVGINHQRFGRSGGVETLCIYWKWATGAEANFGFTLTSSASCAWQVNGLIVRGADPSVSPVFSVANSAGGSTTQTTPSMTAPESQDLSISLLSINSAASLTVTSVPTGYTNAGMNLNYVAGANQAFAASRTVASGSTGTLSWVLSGAPANTTAGVSIMVKGFPTSQAVYRPGSGLQHYFHVDDNSPGQAGPKEIFFRGSETATGFLTGTNFFPTTAQLATNLGIAARKSGTADTTARSWVAVADDRTVYVFVATFDVANQYYGFMMGETYSLMTGDLYRSAVIGRNAINVSTSGSETIGTQVANLTATQGNHYFARSYTGVGGPILFAKAGDYVRGNANAAIGGDGLATPNGPDGSLHLSPLHTYQISPNICRGRMRGMYQICHNTSLFTDGDLISGTGVYAGKTFLIIKVTAGSGVPGMLTFDITGPWDTN